MQALSLYPQTSDIMKNLHSAILTLPLCLLTGLAVGCDEAPEPTADLVSTPEAVEQSMWPLPLEATGVQHRSGKGPSFKAKHLVASDEQASAWVQSIMEMPYTTGPLTDPNGDACASDQSGKYWFLAGTNGGTVERSCDVPAGKQLVFPLLNWFCAFFPELYPDEEAVAQAVPEMVSVAGTLPEGVCSLTLRIDGVDALAQFDATNDLFNVTEESFDIVANDDNFGTPQGFAGGPMTAITAGYYVHLKPLAPGDHVLEFGGALCTNGEVDFETLTTYHVHVGP